MDDGGKLDAGAAAGVDVGASLAKIVLRDADGGLSFQLEPATALDAIVRRVEASGAQRMGLTGGGAAALAQRLGRAVLVNEFAAWGNGAARLLEGDGATDGDPYLLISLGTGTSVMLADGMAVSRVGGTALGGGTVLGLGAALVGSSDFAELAALAERGARHHVDLLVKDIYRPGEIALAGEITAANFGKLARRAADAAPPRREDLAHALMGLVGENVALICVGLSTLHQARHLVFGGATLRGNPALSEILGAIATALGAHVTFLPRGEYAGALGALRLASESA